MNKIAILLVSLLVSPSIMAKGITVSNAYTHTTVAGMKQSGAFVTLTNTEPTNNVLIGASVAPHIAAHTELHTHIHENGIMRMRQVKNGIPLPANQTVELKPGSFHIMFFDLKTTFHAGKQFPMTLKFKNGKRQTVNVIVKEMQAMPHHHQHTHQH